MYVDTPVNIFGVEPVFKVWPPSVQFGEDLHAAVQNENLHMNSLKCSAVSVIEERDWPCPDLNPIQHQKQHPTSVSNLVNFPLNEWKQIPATSSNNLVKSLLVAAE